MVEPTDENGMDQGMECVAAAFSDLVFNMPASRLQLTLGPHRPAAWMERIVLKALGVVRMKFAQECELAFNLASLLDSVNVVEAILRRIFPEEMKIKVSGAGAREVVVAAHMGWPGTGALDADDKRQHSFAWCMALIAEEAADTGAVHVLDYALQHPLVPVAFSFSRPYRCDDLENGLDFLINAASRGAWMHVVHYLIGNPLPLAPPPASRPIRPGNGPNDSVGLQPSYETRVRTESVLLSPENPVASLTELGIYRETPLQNLLSVCDRDPLSAATYLLDQGAPPNSPSLNRLRPLHHAAFHGCPGIVLLLVNHGANVDECDETDGLTPLHCAAQGNNVATAVELLQCGANRDALLVGDRDRFELKTPLGIALEEENDEVARVLLEAGATLLVSRGHFWRSVHIDEKLKKRLLGVEENSTPTFEFTFRAVENVGSTGIRCWS
ncbi:hypothetical protein HDU96_009236 [Phlyctochytrium bullatum]|nr:hypothetical protein HDU96_009236 [Phlyctochytrium bullatum]